jgi:hypothetical protein
MVLLKALGRDMEAADLLDFFTKKSGHELLDGGGSVRPRYISPRGGYHQEAKRRNRAGRFRCGCGDGPRTSESAA